MLRRTIMQQIDPSNYTTAGVANRLAAAEERLNAISYERDQAQERAAELEQKLADNAESRTTTTEAETAPDGAMETLPPTGGDASSISELEEKNLELEFEKRRMQREMDEMAKELEAAYSVDRKTA